MSKTNATESWLGGASSRQEYFSIQLATITNGSVEHLFYKYSDRLNYVCNAFDGNGQKKSFVENDWKFVRGLLFLEVAD